MIKEQSSVLMSMYFGFVSKSLFTLLSVLLQEILEGVTEIDLVVNLKLREDVLMEKCLGRRICSQCGKNFNVASINVKGENGNPGISMDPLLPPPHCMTKLITRSDDTEEVVKERLKIYYEKVSIIAFSSFFLHEKSERGESLGTSCPIIHFLALGYLHHERKPEKSYYQPRSVSSGI